MIEVRDSRSEFETTWAEASENIPVSADGKAHFEFNPVDYVQFNRKYLVVSNLIHDQIFQNQK